jgi:hypothetical protein
MCAIELTGAVVMYAYQVSWRLVQTFRQHEGYASEIWGSLMLILRMERNWRSVLFSWAQAAYYLYQVSWTLVQILKEGSASAVWKAVMLVLLYYWSKRFVEYAVKMASCIMIYVQSFMKIYMYTDAEAILRFCFRNFRGCNSSVSGGRDLWITPSRWGLVPWYHVSQRWVDASRS